MPRVPRSDEANAPAWKRGGRYKDKGNPANHKAETARLKGGRYEGNPVNHTTGLHSGLGGQAFGVAFLSAVGAAEFSPGRKAWVREV